MRNAKRNLEPLLTIEDLDAMPDDGNRYELLEGDIFMSRSPSYLHQVVLHRLQVEIELFLRANPLGIVVPGLGVIFDNFNGVIPDLIFISDARLGEILPGERVYGAPDLAIEILSPGAENDRRDRNIKKRLYGQHGVREYWVVDPEGKTVEVYSLKRRRLELIATVSGAEEIPSSMLKGFRLSAGEVFKGIGK